MLSWQLEELPGILDYWGEMSGQNCTGGFVPGINFLGWEMSGIVWGRGNFFRGNFRRNVPGAVIW